MNEHLWQILIPASGLISGLVGMYVGLQNRALLAEVRKELAEQENKLILRLNGTYVRQPECALREINVHDRIQALSNELHEVRANERSRQE